MSPGMIDHEEIEQAAQKPRWGNIAVVVFIILALIFAGIAIAGFYAYRGNNSSQAIEDQGARRDCVTLVQAARRAVFDNVDIYKAIQIEQLSTALLDAQQGIKPNDAEVEAFAENDKKLRAALSEARRLQPASVLDRLIREGGTIAGTHYDACPT